MDIKELMEHHGRDGVVEWIGVRPARREPMVELQSAEAVAGRGLQGDRYNSRNGGRQVTLIQAEHLEAVASFLSLEAVHPGITRRNIVVRGINLGGLKGKRFRIGSALLEYTGECHPCSRMEEQLGHGGYNAMRGHGGITARILESGLIRKGDPVAAVTASA